MTPHMHSTPARALTRSLALLSEVTGKRNHNRPYLDGFVVVVVNV